MYLWKRMPPRFLRRRVAVTTKSFRRYWFNSLEQVHAGLFAAAHRWVSKNAVVWDVGANLGMFSFAAAIRAGKGGHVYAFEPDLETAGLMNKSLASSVADEADVCIYPVAVGNREGEARFVVSGYRSAASALHGFGRFGKNRGDRERTVPIHTLDCLAKSLLKPTVIKIDVEGAENLVLEGAQQLIQSCRPILLLETSDGDKGARTVELLRSWDYVWGAYDGTGELSNDRPALENIVAVPATSAKHVPGQS